MRRGEPSLAAGYKKHPELKEMLEKAEAEWKAASVSLHHLYLPLLLAEFRYE